MLINNKPKPPTFDSFEKEREHRLERLVASFRLFSKFGFDEGPAGHITVRDPEHTDQLWVNPFGKHFSQITVEDLLLINHEGEIIKGNGMLNKAAYAIHAAVHIARPDVVAAAHAHSTYGKTWSTLGRKLDPITQDSCRYYTDHEVFNDYTGEVLDPKEGQRIGQALGDKKAVILQNHGLLTVGKTVDSAAWWFIGMERCCQSQLMAEAAGQPILIRPEVAEITHKQVGTEDSGWFAFQPLFDLIVKEQPDILQSKQPV